MEHRVKNNNKNKLFIAGAMLLAAIYYCTMLYEEDITVSFGRGIDFLEALFSGSFPSGYSFESSFYMPIHIVFAIWGIPCWLLIHLGLATAKSLFCLLWAKILPVAAFGGCIGLTNKLLRKLNCKQIEFWTYISATMFISFFTALGCGMYDHFELFLGLLGFASLLEEEKPSLRSLLILSLAVSFKVFFIFGAITLILLKEKRLRYFIKDMLYIFSVPVCFWAFARFCVSLDPTVKVKEIAYTYMDRFFASTEIGGIWPISLFGVAILTAFAIAYLLPPDKTPSDFLLKASWLICIEYLSFFLFVYCHPQWLNLLAPFFVLVAASNEKRFKESAIFLAITDSAIFFLQVCRFNWVFLYEGAFSLLCLKNISTNGGVLQFADVLESYGLFSYLPYVEAIVFVFGGLMIAMNNPWRRWEHTDIVNISENESVSCLICGYRVVAIAAFWLLTATVNYIL